jgi:hypothetical protein
MENLMPLALHRGAPVVCVQCGKQTARRSRQQRYCSDRCRNQNARLCVKTDKVGQDSQTVTNPPKKPSKINSSEAPFPRSSLVNNAVQTEYFGGGRWHEIISPDGVRCYVTRLWGNPEGSP